MSQATLKDLNALGGNMRARSCAASSLRPFRVARAPQNRRCVHARFFKFGKNGAKSEEAGMTGNMSRDDFDKDEMEQYFNYTGRLAMEQNYDSFNKYLEKGMHPVDVIMLWACEEGDGQKLEDVLNAGADVTVKDLNGKTAMELASNDEVKDLLKQANAVGA